MAAFWKAERTETRAAEERMRVLVKIERNLAREGRMRPYQRAGEEALMGFVEDCKEGEMIGGAAGDVVFIAIDFEGGPNSGRRNSRFRGFGVARLDTRHVVGQGRFCGPEDIAAEDYRLRCSHHRGFLFGETTRINYDFLKANVLKSLRIPGRKVVLVGHMFACNEWEFLQCLDIKIEEDRPEVIGIVDTLELSRSWGGPGVGLRRLLGLLGITVPSISLHCAGNDACFTMKAMIGLLQMLFPDQLIHLDGLKMLPLVSTQRKRSEKPDWSGALDGALFSEWELSPPSEAGSPESTESDDS